MPTARAVPGPGFKHWGVLGRAWGAQGVGWIAACAGRAQVDSGLVCPLAVTRGGCLSLARFLRARAAKWGPLGHGLWRGLPLGARVLGRHLARREHGRGRCGLAGHAHRLKLFTAFCPHAHNTLKRALSSPTDFREKYLPITFTPGGAQMVTSKTAHEPCLQVHTSSQALKV